MNSQISPLKIDLTLHGVCFIIQMALLIPGGFFQSGPTPPLIYPFFLILATITLSRQWESLSEYGTRLIFIPSIYGVFIFGFCMINEMGGTFWAFYTPRWHAVFVRVIWFQLGLLLIHPEVFIAVRREFSKIFNYLIENGYFSRKLPITLILIGIVMWLLRSQNISPDGYDWLKHSIVAKDWVRYLREPLGTFILRLWVLGGIRIFHWDPYVSITILDIVCGFISTWLLWRVFQELIPKQHTGYIFALLLSSCGYTQIFVGNIEIYALLHLGLSLFLYASMRYLKDEISAWLVGLVFAIMFCIHLSSGWWLPIFLILPYLKTLVTPSHQPFKDVLNQLGAFFVFGFIFGIFVLQYGFAGDYYAMWEHFWSDEVMNVGTDAAMFHSIETFLDPDFYLTMMNEYFYMMPSIFPLILVLILAFPKKHQESPVHVWLIAMAGFYLIYTLVWHPDRAFPADWDIFSGLTIPLILVLGIYLANLNLPKQAIRYILYQSIVFSLLFLVLQILRNHWKITEWPLFI